MKLSLTIAASGVTGLSPAQLLAGAPKEPPKVTRRRTRYDLLDCPDEIITEQIASEEREILRFINPSPLPTTDFAHLDQLHAQMVAQVGIPKGYLK